MADIFLSYASADRAQAAFFAKELTKAGFSVWWDRNIYSGADFSAEIDRELSEAKAVIVLWSKAAIDSEWVRDEAAQARKLGKLIPVRLDDVEPPLGFRQRQATNMRGWTGDGKASAFQILVSSVKHVLGEEAEPIVPTHVETKSIFSTPGFKLGAIAACALALILALVVAATGRNQSRINAASPVAENDTISRAVGLAVLPFKNISSVPEQDYFADGLTEELLNWLANVEGLNVLGRNTSFAFRGNSDDLEKIAGQLNVEYILDGSIRLVDNDLRVSVQLIAAESGFHIWSETYDRYLDDIFSIEDEISRQVVTELLGVIPESGVENPASAGDVDPHAHELYLEGRALLARRQWVEAFNKFYDATETDPNHALALAYVAAIGAYLRKYNYSVDPSINDLDATIDNSLARAVELKPEAADVLYAQGYVLLQSEQHIESDSILAQRIREYFDQAIRAYPRHVEAINAGMSLSESSEERIELIQRVLDIDPGHPAARGNLALNYFQSGNKEAARQLIEETFRLFPETRRVFGTNLLRIMGFTQESFLHLLRDWDGPGLDSTDKHRRAIALADLGAINEAAYLLRDNASHSSGEIHDYWSYSLAAYLEGSHQERLEYLQRAIEAKNEEDRWLNVEYGRALISSGEPGRGLSYVRKYRPDLQDGAQPQIQINETIDEEAFATARALRMLGRNIEAEKIWRAVIDSPVEVRPKGWRAKIALAIAHANLDEHEEALALLEAAYSEGFRFLYSYESDSMLSRNFYDPEGLFTPIYNLQKFQKFRQKVERENEAILERLNDRYGFLERVRAEMAASVGGG